MSYDNHRREGSLGTRFYLCDYCQNNAMDVWLDTCLCRSSGMEHVPKTVMHDGAGRPKDVCDRYEPREKKS